MAKRVSGKRYAEAIFQLGLEHDLLDQWAEDLAFIDQVLQDDEFSAFLKHAEVPLQEKIRAIDAVFPEVNPLVRNMIALLVTRGLVDLVHDMRVGYGQLLDKHRGRQQVEVTSAVPLEDPERERISRFVSDLVQKQVVGTTQVDESILGGVIIQIRDQLLDGSTRTRLEELRQQLRSDTAVVGA